MKLFKIILIAIALMAGGVGMAQVPEKPAQQAPIVDLADIINNDSLVTALNAQLDSLSKKTQNQIVVVTVKDMGGLDPKEFATTLGQQWGIGGKALNNGFVIAVKPKDENGSGKIGFATGYGLEGVLPDVFCKRLQTEYMVPHFKEGDYAAGIKAAIDEIVPVVLNEYNEAQALAGDTKKKEGGTGNGWFIIAGIIGVIALFALLRKRSKPAGGAPAQEPQASKLKEEAPKEEKNEPEEPEEDPDDEPQDPEPPAPKKPTYKYGYGGGDFGGGGASTEF